LQHKQPYEPLRIECGPEPLPVNSTYHLALRKKEPNNELKVPESTKSKRPIKRKLSTKSPKDLLSPNPLKRTRRTETPGSLGMCSTDIIRIKRQAERRMRHRNTGTPSESEETIQLEEHDYDQQPSKFKVGKHFKLFRSPKGEDGFDETCDFHRRQLRLQEIMGQDKKQTKRKSKFRSSFDLNRKKPFD
jgi:hypothetical protein